MTELIVFLIFFGLYKIINAVVSGGETKSPPPGSTLEKNPVHPSNDTSHDPIGNQEGLSEWLTGMFRGDQ